LGEPRLKLINRLPAFRADVLKRRQSWFACVANAENVLTFDAKVDGLQAWGVMARPVQGNTHTRLGKNVPSTRERVHEAQPESPVAQSQPQGTESAYAQL
jgi:hypothetical protein